jgi:hypothetical protein
MQSSGIIVPRLVMAGLTAGGWVFLSGILMAAVFGYREMAAAFGRIGLAIPRGTRPFVTHAVVRLGYGVVTVALFAVAVQVLPVGRAVLFAAGLAWLLGSFFPYLVVTEWGLFPWRLAWMVWGWSAGEFLIAAFIGRLICYRP